MIAGFPKIYVFTNLTGFPPKYFDLESVSFPVIGSIEVLMMIPF